MPYVCAQPWSVDYGMKLLSLMSAPKINDVPTMDVLTERELNALILQEPDEHPSHVLSLIFKTFSPTIPFANSLTVSLNTKTPLYLRNFRKKQNFTNKGKNKSVSLYDTVNHWVLPTCEWCASKSPDKSRQDLREDEKDDKEDEEQDSEEEGNDGKDVAVGIDSDDWQTCLMLAQHCHLQDQYSLASYPYPDLTLVILVILAFPFALYLSLQQSQYIWPDPFTDEAYPCSVPPPD
ncbi:uncharacterized protein EDB93DRAFT_1256319 [Suillus bovinus]|uniref:uncharacterized protein n=1 Tax=Suillus bovinus TaxID=48563 RepID=UPI001B8843E8|nr:uncharacterized protein EDB93DRAFT_1256319 [Suillus bovinus]KAG2129256.1 hypothetical protein EDB93DRAFT_1256319 [Suillus bovinus]